MTQCQGIGRAITALTGSCASAPMLLRIARLNQSYHKLLQSYRPTDLQVLCPTTFLQVQFNARGAASHPSQWLGDPSGHVIYTRQHVSIVCRKH
eukprot:4391252-Pyramimonas_sp.AAC.1